MRLRYKSLIESHDITLNIDNVCLDKNKVCLDPSIKDNGLLKQLKKNRIIKEICGFINYNNKDIPIAIINTGILKQYDYHGIMEYQNKVLQNG